MPLTFFYQQLNFGKTENKNCIMSLLSLRAWKMCTMLRNATHLVQSSTPILSISVNANITSWSCQLANRITSGGVLSSLSRFYSTDPPNKYDPPSPYRKPGPRRYGWVNKLYGGGKDFSLIITLIETIISRVCKICNSYNHSPYKNFAGVMMILGMILLECVFSQYIRGIIECKGDHSSKNETETL